MPKDNRPRNFYSALATAALALTAGVTGAAKAQNAPGASAMVATSVKADAGLDQLASGFVSEDGTRYGVLSDIRAVGMGHPVQFAVIPSQGEPTIYAANIESCGLGRSEGCVINTGVGKLTTGFLGANLETPSGTLHLLYDNDPDLFRQVGVKSPGIAKEIPASVPEPTAVPDRQSVPAVSSPRIAASNDLPSKQVNHDPKISYNYAVWSNGSEIYGLMVQPTSDGGIVPQRAQLVIASPNAKPRYYAADASRFDDRAGGVIQTGLGTITSTGGFLPKTDFNVKDGRIIQLNAGGTIMIQNLQKMTGPQTKLNYQP